jgi:hypothetical protein
VGGRGAQATRRGPPEAERARLHAMIGRGVAPTSALTHARILVKANQGEAGLDAAIYRKPPARSYRRRLDGPQEAQLVALTCSAPPEGHKRWTLRLLADRLVALGMVESVSYETVRQALQQPSASRG